MVCDKCFAWYEDTEMRCPKCGAEGENQSIEERPESGLTEKEKPKFIMNKEAFYKHENLSTLRISMRICAIIMYVLLAYTLYATFVIFAYLDFVFPLLLACVLMALIICVHKLKSRVAALFLLIYFVFNLFSLVINSENFIMGIGLVVISSLFVLYTIIYQKAWKDYQQTGVVPEIKL